MEENAKYRNVCLEHAQLGCLKLFERVWVVIYASNIIHVKTVHIIENGLK